MEESRGVVRVVEIASAILTVAAVLIAATHRAVLGVALVTVGMYLLFLFVNRIPVRMMNLTVKVSQQNQPRVESIVRPRLAAIGLITIGLFTWLTATAALNALTLYLATFWLFLAAIAALLISMVRRLQKAA